MLLASFGHPIDKRQKQKNIKNPPTATTVTAPRTRATHRPHREGCSPSPPPPGCRYSSCNKRRILISSASREMNFFPRCRNQAADIDTSWRLAWKRSFLRVQVCLSWIYEAAVGIGVEAEALGPSRFSSHSHITQPPSLLEIGREIQHLWADL